MTVGAAGAYAAYQYVNNLHENNSFFPIASMDVTGGSEFQINTITTGNQQYPAVASFTNGDFVVVWRSDVISTPIEISGQRYASNGATVGSAFQVTTCTTCDVSPPSVATLTNDEFVVVWSSNYLDGSSYGIFGQRYDNSGTLIGSQFQVNTYASNTQYEGFASSLTNGGFVVTWESASQDGSGDGVYGQRFDSGGLTVGSEFQVNTYTTNSQYASSTTPLQNGGFVVVWMSTIQDGYGNGVYGQRYDTNGAPAGSEFRVNTQTFGDQNNPNVATLSNGNFIVVWFGYSEASGTFDIFAQRYDSNGATIGNEFQVNTYTSYNQKEARVAALSQGDFIITWSSENQDGSNLGVIAKRYDNTGTAVGDEFFVNTYTGNHQYSPAVAALQGGSFGIAWTSTGQDGSNDGVFGRIFKIVPELVGETINLNYVEKALPLTISQNITIIDANNNLLGSTVSLTTNFNPFQDRLSFVNQTNIVGFYNETLGRLDLSGTANSIDYQTALRNVTYYNTDSNPDILTRTVSFKIHDASIESAPYTRQITITPVNDPPVLGNNSLTILEGGTKIINYFDLSATDVDSPGAGLFFAASNVQRGQFELISNPGSAIVSFTQQQIIDSLVRFMHVDSELAPSYDISVSDGSLSTTPSNANINFININDEPKLINNYLTINAGQEKVFTSADLSATDIDNDDQTLTFLINAIQNGQFEFVDNPGIAVSSFMQQQISNESVRFVHSGGNLLPGYQVSVSDGSLSTLYVSANVTFTPANSPAPLPSSPNLNSFERTLIAAVGIGAVVSIGAGALVAARFFKPKNQKKSSWQAAESKQEPSQSKRVNAVKQEKALKTIIEQGRKAYQQGKLETAKTLHETALLQSQAIYGDSHPETANVLNTLGVIYSDLNQFEKASTTLEQALVTKIKVYGEQHFETGKTYNNIGISYAKQNRYQEAQGSFENALAIFQKEASNATQVAFVQQVSVSLVNCKKMINEAVVVGKEQTDNSLAMAELPRVGM